ncbi:MAG: STAS domain-containing protein [candidate division Zixibacteria bacterium]|nr:STAS domain-containing protein [candidate division Zixibacteria bacterium]
MKIEQSQTDGVAVLTPHGSLMGGPDTGELDEKLYQLLNDGYHKVVLDLGRTDWINSSGISILIHHWKKFDSAGASLRMANLTKKIERILVISRLSSVFDCYDTLDQAVASFKE